MTTKQDQESFSSKKDLLDLLAQRKEEERQVRDADGGDDACESVASKVFLGSPLCLFLCADEETRRSYLERYASTVATYEELEGIVDPFQVMSMATFMSGWGTCGNLMYKFPIFTVVAAVGCRCYAVQDHRLQRRPLMPAHRAPCDSHHLQTSFILLAIPSHRESQQLGFSSCLMAS